MCDCIGEMAAYIHGGEEESWPELLPFLFRCTQNPSADARSSALFIFSRMAMYMTDALQEYFEVRRFASRTASPRPFCRVGVALRLATRRVLGCQARRRRATAGASVVADIFLRIFF